MIGVIDYGMGNLYSVSKALERIDAPYFVSEHPDELKRADSYILPGVGAFRDAMEILTETGLKTFIQAAANEGKPLLGICLGMQLLFEESEEHGASEGLGLLKGKVVKLKDCDQAGNRLKVPHMGWNLLKVHRESPLLPKRKKDSRISFIRIMSAESKRKLCLQAPNTVCVYPLSSVLAMYTGPSSIRKRAVRSAC